MADFNGTPQDDLHLTVSPVENGDIYDGRSGTDTYSYFGFFPIDFVVDLQRGTIQSSTSLSSHQGNIFGFEVINTRDGDDIILGDNRNFAVNQFYSGGGADRLAPGSDGIRTGDIFDGGGGTSDTLDLSGLSGAHLIDLENGRVTNLTSGQMAQITGLEIIEGTDGNDRFIEQSGVASDLFGNLGNDTIVAAVDGGTGDNYVGGDGIDLLDLSAQTEDFQVILDGVVRPLSTAETSMNSGFEQLDSGAGHDSILSGNDADTTYTIWGRDGADYIFGGQGRDILAGGNGGDELRGSTNNDTLKGNTGDDRLYGGAGADSLVGQADNDSLFGGDDNDRLKGGGGRDTLYGDNGEDFLKGGGSNDIVFGGAGDDRVSGNAENDTLRGNAGNDALKGGGGNDRMDGDVGDDRLKGGAGDDVFVFRDGGGRDVILDFRAANDRLAIDADLLSGQTTGAAVVRVFAEVRNGDLLLDFGRGDELTLENFTNTNALGSLVDII